MSIDREYKIRISTVADNSGAKQAVDGLKEIASETSKVGEATKEVAGKTEFLNLKKSELKKLVGELKTAFPELASTMRLFLDPRVVGLSLLIKSFQILRDQIAGLKELLNSSGWEGSAKAIEAGKQALDDAAVAANQYWHELNRAKTETDGIAEGVERTVGAIHKQAQAEAELRNAKMGLEIANVNAAEKRGQLSAEQASVQRAIISDRYAAEERHAKDIEENNAFNALLQERTKILNRISEIESGLRDKQREAEAAQSRLAKDSAQREIDARNLAASEEKIAQYREEMEKRSKFGMRSAIFDELSDSAIREAMQSELDARDRLRRVVAKNSNERVSRQSEDKSIISDAAAMESELQNARQKLRSLDSDIPVKQEDYLRGVNSRRSVGRINTITSSVNSGMDSIITAGAPALDAQIHGQKISEDQRAQVDALQRLYTSVTGSSKEFVAVVNYLTQHHLTLQQEIQIMRGQITNLRNR